MGISSTMNIRDFITLTTWWGKCIGAVFGFLSGGPLGALFGLLIGNFFDRGFANYYTNPHLFYYSEKRASVKKVFLESTFSIMGYLAKADGHISKQEITMAKNLMDAMRLNQSQKIQAQNLFNEGKKSTFTLEPALKAIIQSCRHNRELLNLFADIQYRIARVDGLNPQKIAVLNLIFSAAGFAPLHQQHRFYEDFSYHHATDYAQAAKDTSSQNKHYYKPHAPSGLLAHAYALLEIPPDAEKQEVKRAYRRLISQNHPDKLIAKGFSEAKIKAANDKTDKIMKAYQLICSSKGW